MKRAKIILMLAAFCSSILAASTVCVPVFDAGNLTSRTPCIPKNMAAVKSTSLRKKSSKSKRPIKRVTAKYCALVKKVFWGAGTWGDHYLRRLITLCSTALGISVAWDMRKSQSLNAQEKKVLDIVLREEGEKQESSNQANVQSDDVLDPKREIFDGRDDSELVNVASEDNSKEADRKSESNDVVLEQTYVDNSGDEKLVGAVAVELPRVDGEPLYVIPAEDVVHDIDMVCDLASAIGRRRVNEAETLMERSGCALASSLDVWKALVREAANSSLDLAKKWLKCDKKLSVENFKQLMFFIVREKSDLMQLFIDQNKQALIGITDERGLTLLDKAVECDSRIIARMLIRAGLHMNGCYNDHNGNKRLVINDVVEQKKFFPDTVATVLRYKKADAMAVDYKNKNILQVAFENKCPVPCYIAAYEGGIDVSQAIVSMHSFPDASRELQTIFNEMSVLGLCKLTNVSAEQLHSYVSPGYYVISKKKLEQGIMEVLMVSNPFVLPNVVMNIVVNYIVPATPFERIAGRFCYGVTATIDDEIEILMQDRAENIQRWRG